MRKIIQISNEWQQKRASKLFVIQGGYAFKSTDATENGVRWLKIANVGLGNIKWEEESYLPADFLQLHSNFCLKGGDIVVAMTRPLLNGVLKIAQLSDDDSPCLLNQRVGRVTPKENVRKDFLFHVLKTRHLAYKLESDLLGTDPPNLSIKTFRNIKILLPPLPEQKAIADLLSTWDEAIEKTERLIQAKEKRFKWLLRSLISEPQNSRKGMEWKKVKLGEVCKISNKDKLTSVENRFLLTVKLHCLGIEKNYRIKPRLTERGRPYYQHQFGDFLIGRQNFHNGGFGIIPSELDGGITSNAISVLIINESKLSKVFLWYQFLNPNYYKKVGYVMDGTGQKELSDKQMLKLKILLPPLKKQRQIAETLSVIQQEIDLLKQLAEKYKTQKCGLMQKALTGEWRIKPEIIKQCGGCNCD